MDISSDINFFIGNASVTIFGDDFASMIDLFKKSLDLQTCNKPVRYFVGEYCIKNSQVHP